MAKEWYPYVRLADFHNEFSEGQVRDLPEIASQVRFVLRVFLITIVLAVSAFAFDYPLSPTAISEAYFLGQRHDEKAIEFLGKYFRRLPLPDKGPYISEISLLTPYAQVVSHSWDGGMGYSAQQAQDDYRSHGDAIRVKVRIEFTNTYSAMQGAKPDQGDSKTMGYTLRPPDFWHTFGFELSQKGRLIPPESTQGEPIYDDSGFVGAEVRLAYDLKEFASAETSIAVVTPEHQRVMAKFDLSELR